MKFFKFVKKSYPYESSVIKRLFVCFVFGIFISLFLFAFQPFNLQELDHSNKTLFIFGYGIITFISLLITMFVIPFFFKKHFFADKWTIGKEILHITLTILFITTLNIIYSTLFCENCKPFQEDLFIVFIFSFLSVLLIGLIPITFMVIIYQNILLKKHIKNANSINQNLSSEKKQETNIIKIYSSNKKNLINISSSKLIAIEANGNYINVYFENEGKLNREIIRNTLKITEKEIKTYSNFVRCHKSYIVNLSKLKKVSGNAQGYRLVFNLLGFDVPVSRNLSKQILEKIRI